MEALHRLERKEKWPYARTITRLWAFLVMPRLPKSKKRIANWHWSTIPTNTPRKRRKSTKHSSKRLQKPMKYSPMPKSEVATIEAKISILVSNMEEVIPSLISIRVDSLEEVSLVEEVSNSTSVMVN